MTPDAALFGTSALHARELSPHEVPALQALFDANPFYFQAVHGRPAHADEAQAEFDERPPAHLAFSRRWVLGVFDRAEVLVGVIGVLTDFCAPRVWHVSLFLLSTPLHGQQVAAPLYAAMEAWMRAGGAHWARLGVVMGHARAERFWARQGFADVRRRAAVDTGGPTRDLRVQVKPLAGGTLAEYLAQVPRDRPDADLP